MPEQRPFHDQPQRLQYGEFQAKRIQRELGKFPSLHQWVTESVTRLPEMDVREVPLTNDKWQAELTEVPGQIRRIRGAFFTIDGARITTPAFSWDQPGIQQTTNVVELPTPEGMISADVSGIVGVIQDTKGRVLLTMGQEPFSDTPKHGIVRTPLQTSATKFADLMNGDAKKDPAFTKLLETLFGDNVFDSFKEYLASGSVNVWLLGPADANRLHSRNIGIAFTVDDEAKQEALVADGKNRWVSKEEQKALELAGLLNGHTAVAISANRE